VLAAIANLLGTVDIYTLYNFLPKEILAAEFPNASFHTSALQHLPLVKHYYRALFFLAPMMIEQFDVTGYDAVVSSSAAFARGVLTRPDQPHLCYVHSPVRYAWDEQFSYLEQAKLGLGPKGLLFRYLLHRMRTWDVRTAHGPDLLLANSEFVRSRIKKIYGRESRVVHPPINLDELRYTSNKDDYYVTASFLAPYKRTDLVVEAFTRMPQRRLVVVGQGQQLAKLRSIAGPNVAFRGHLNREDYVAMVAGAKAFVFAGCEDFGIALAEAQACGTPLIAFGRGGARDIVRPLGCSAQPTGVTFGRQSADAVQQAVEYFEEGHQSIRPSFCRDNASRFSLERFNREIEAAVHEVMSLHSHGPARKLSVVDGERIHA
jgi:glycosyltransferase involved in cell wall biosynthesis